MSNKTPINILLNIVFNVATFGIPWLWYKIKRLSIDDMLWYGFIAIMASIFSAGGTWWIEKCKRDNIEEIEFKNKEWSYIDLGNIEEIYVLNKNNTYGIIKTDKYYLTDLYLEWLDGFKTDARVWLQHKRYKDHTASELCVEGADKCYNYDKIGQVHIPEKLGEPLENLKLENDNLEMVTLNE